MNLHHLELFHYLCVHGGITAAARKMPYGIQQPAMSLQLARLEKDLGVELFERKPFRLTPEGERLHQATASFFHQTDRLSDLVKGREMEEIRVAGASEFLANHVPAFISKIQKKRPGFRVRLYERRFPEAIPMLERHEVDVVVTVPEGGVRDGIERQKLVDLPLVLLVPNGIQGDFESIIRCSEKNRPALISLSQEEILSKLFFESLHQKGRDWTTSIEVSSLGLVEQYVAQGMGVGLSVRTPQQKLPKGVRAIDLRGFPKIPVVAYWRSGISSSAHLFVEYLREKAKTLKG